MLVKNYFNPPQHWIKPCWGLLFILFLSITVFFETWSSIVEIWIRSKTFNHGFVIAPISAWLISSRRNFYSQLYPTFSYGALFAVLFGGLLWLVANLSHVLVVKQFAVVGVLVSGFWAILGNRVAFNMLFPLSFLFFMVPVGEELIPLLREFTSTFTVNLIRLTGLPVYREGNFFMLTSGSWSVVEACSGINYLIASITLGFVYAYLNYSQYWKRVLFITLSCVVPVIANGFRAYMIVMIGHLSNMTLAVGVDHLIYGGIFFGLVTLLLFYLGSFWRDSIPNIEKVAAIQPTQYYSTRQALLMLFVLSFSIAAWPLSYSWLEAKQSSSGLPNYLSKIELDGWRKTSDPNWGWLPEFKGPVATKTDFFTQNEKIVGIYHASFGKESQGYELVNSQNILVPTSESNHWRDINSDPIPLLVDKKASINVNETILVSDEKYLLVLEWYQIGDKITANAYQAKWHQLLKRLTGNACPELKVVLWTDTSSLDYVPARSALQQFAKDWRNRYPLRCNPT